MSDQQQSEHVSWPMIRSVKEIRKSVNIWRSYGQKYSVSVFVDSRVVQQKWRDRYCHTDCSSRSALLTWSLSKWQVLWLIDVLSFTTDAHLLWLGRSFAARTCRTLCSLLCAVGDVSHRSKSNPETWSICICLCSSLCFTGESSVKVAATWRQPSPMYFVVSVVHWPQEYGSVLVGCHDVTNTVDSALDGIVHWMESVALRSVGV